MSKTKKALRSLKRRIEAVEEYFELKHICDEKHIETLKCKDEIKILVEAYEKQIELNKKQNIKIKNQRGMLKVLQQKRCDET